MSLFESWLDVWCVLYEILNQFIVKSLMVCLLWSVWKLICLQSLIGLYCKCLLDNSMWNIWIFSCLPRVNVFVFFRQYYSSCLPRVNILFFRQYYVLFLFTTCEYFVFFRQYYFSCLPRVNVLCFSGSTTLLVYHVWMFCVFQAVLLFLFTTCDSICCSTTKSPFIPKTPIPLPANKQ